MKYDVAVVGTGRVGLPLMLILAKEGFRVIGIERSEELVGLVKKRKFPFKEPGFDEIIRNVDFEITSNEDILSKSENIIVTVGTPMLEHLEIDFTGITRVLKSIIKNAKKGQNFILRSTVAIGTTEYFKNAIEDSLNWKVGEDFYISFCPERILEGKALEELYSLPQIVGVEDEKSFLKAEEIFSRFSPEIVRTSIRGAELIKLFNNASRYVYFAVVNYFFMVADIFDEDANDLIEKANRNYPRKILYTPGFTGGPCLRKDFSMLSENFPNVDLLISAWRTNESYTAFLVNSIDKRKRIRGKRVGVLGLTFKKDSDDMRDSLIPKFIRYLIRKNPREVLVHEPHLPIGWKLDLGIEVIENQRLENVLSDPDILIIAQPHRTFIENYRDIVKILPDETLICDPWNVGGIYKTFYRAGDLK